MASEIRVNKIENRSGLGTVTFGDTATVFSTGVNFTGVVTATTFDGSGASLTNLPAANLTGTLPAISGENLTGIAATDNVRTGILDVAGIATFRNDVNVGTAVTITESGINAVGVITATSFVGSGSGITGITTGASQILEQFYVPCNGYTVNTAHGTRTVETVSGVQNLSTTYVDLTGSTITYRPPTGTTIVVYKFHFHHTTHDADGFAHYRFYIGSDEVTYARITRSHEFQGKVTHEWPIQIGGSADTDAGVLASWNSDLVLKIQVREYGSSNEAKLHVTNNWDGGSTDMFSMPLIGITAIGTPS